MPSTHEATETLTAVRKRKTDKLKADTCKTDICKTDKGKTGKRKQSQKQVQTLAQKLAENSESHRENNPVSDASSEQENAELNRQVELPNLSGKSADKSADKSAESLPNDTPNNNCVRIKGVNSDYTFDVGAGQIVENKSADPLYLKIFICPNQMPSRIEPPHHGHWCEGTDADCPAPDQAGHALISLHQYEGIALVAQQITLQTPTGATIQLHGESIDITPGPNGVVTIHGNLAVNGWVSQEER
jgi:hypothetical protein